MPEIKYKGVSYVAAEAPTPPADFMAPAPPPGAVSPSLLPAIEPGAPAPKVIVESNGWIVHSDPDVYPPPGFVEAPDLEAARRRNQSELEIIPSEHIDVYKILHIDSAKAMAHAFAYWTVEALLEYDRGLRTSLCRALIDMAQRYQRPPDSTWVQMVENPSFFDQWRAERTTSILDDDTDNLEAPADGEELPRVAPEESPVEAAPAPAAAATPAPPTAPAA